MKNKIVIVNSNPIHKRIVEKCKADFKAITILEQKKLTPEFLKKIKPHYIFFLHWSYIIPKEIWSKHNCIVFHMTDLPFGRGGSPLQNLVTRKYSETKISALKVEAGIDTGKIYLKKKLSLLGTAEEIFLRVGDILYNMIHEIILYKMEPKSQKGKVTLFKRRAPKESNISDLSDLNSVFDFIRMLDADGYPKAFIETAHLRFEFSRASLKVNGIIADVKITTK